MILSDGEWWLMYIISLAVCALAIQSPQSTMQHQNVKILKACIWHLPPRRSLFSTDACTFFFSVSLEACILGVLNLQSTTQCLNMRSTSRSVRGWSSMEDVYIGPARTLEGQPFLDFPIPVLDFPLSHVVGVNRMLLPKENCFHSRNFTHTVFVYACDDYSSFQDLFDVSHFNFLFVFMLLLRSEVDCKMLMHASDANRRRG